MFGTPLGVPCFIWNRASHALVFSPVGAAVAAIFFVLVNEHEHRSPDGVQLAGRRADYKHSTPPE